jgi:hypothetical protein
MARYRLSTGGIDELSGGEVFGLLDDSGEILGEGLANYLYAADGSLIVDGEIVAQKTPLRVGDTLMFAMYPDGRMSFALNGAMV